MYCNCYPLAYKIRVIDCYNIKLYPIRELLSIFGISRGSLYNWLKLYKDGQLQEKIKYFKESKYTIEVKEYIHNYVAKKINFSYRKLIYLIDKRFNIKSHKSSIYNILKEKGLSRKRIKIKVNYMNKIKRRQKIMKLTINIRKADIDNIISIDESSFDTHINSHYGWNKKGKELTVSKIKQRVRYSVISAISNKKIIYSQIIKGSVNGDTFLTFIQNVINKISPTGILFMDNARIHHYKKLTAYMETIPNTIIYNVPYCSEYNPIEMVFSKVKSIVHKRSNNENITKLKQNIEYGFKKITLNNLKGYYKKSLSILI